MKVLSLTLTLLTTLLTLTSATPIDEANVLTRQVKCATKGGMCAGFIGIPCCTGYKCTGVPPGVADGSGTCA